jgi:aspartate/methionine/tyrosine aminotransferase
MTEQNKQLLVQRQAETQQWETVRRPDGSTYVVPRNPDDKSLR